LGTSNLKRYELETLLGSNDWSMEILMRIKYIIDFLFSQCDEYLYFLSFFDPNVFYLLNSPNPNYKGLLLSLQSAPFQTYSGKVGKYYQELLELSNYYGAALTMASFEKNPNFPNFRI